MTSLSNAPTAVGERGRRLAAVGAGAAWSAALAAVGTFAGDNRHSVASYLIVLAIIAVTAVGTYAVADRVVTRAGERAIARTAVALGVLAVLTLVVFYLGLMSVLAAGAGYLAVTASRREERWRPASLAALGMSIVAVALATLLAFVG
jgi:hypothetical protein